MRGPGGRCSARTRGACPDRRSSPWPCSRCTRSTRWRAGTGSPSSAICQGGITCAEDALEFMIAGASAVGVGTALFYGPLVRVRINEGLADYVREHNLDCLSRLVGTLELDPAGG